MYIICIYTKYVCICIHLYVITYNIMYVYIYIYMYIPRSSIKTVLLKLSFGNTVHVGCLQIRLSVTKRPSKLCHATRSQTHHHWGDIIPAMLAINISCSFYSLPFRSEENGWEQAQSFSFSVLVWRPDIRIPENSEVVLSKSWRLVWKKAWPSGVHGHC